MPKVVACIIARTVSTRLPLKVLRHIDGDRSMLGFLIARLKQVQVIDEIFICTSGEAVDDVLEDIAVQFGVRIYRGSPDQVIERMLAVGGMSQADIVLRITGDNPLTSCEYINRQVALLIDSNLDYVRLIDAPLGAAAEVIRFEALQRCSAMMDPSVSEYLMLFIFEPKHFKCGVIKPFEQDYASYSVTVDTPDDLTRTRMLLARFDGDALQIKLEDVIHLYGRHEFPAAVIKPSGKIKLPYNKETSYAEFKADMQRRVSESKLLKLYE